MQMINLREGIAKDINEISRFHYEYINRGFLSSLGISFLKLMYRSMVNSKYAFCFVAEENQKVIGFISGTTDINEFYKDFLRKNSLKGSIVLLPKIINPVFLKGILETLFYPTKKNKELPNAELLSIVVDEDYRNKGISQRLFKRLVEEFKKRDVNEFKVVVGSNLLPACKFYEKMGGVFHSEIKVHKGEKSRVYVWGI